MRKRLSIEAHGALREALSAVTWNKKPFEVVSQLMPADGGLCASSKTVAVSSHSHAGKMRAC